jgi:hypothetical protein
MAKQSVSSKAETNQTVDYKKVAWNILCGPVSDMYQPLAKLRAIESLVSGFGTGDLDLQTEDLSGLSYILAEIVNDWQGLADRANEIFHGANNSGGCTDTR